MVSLKRSTIRESHILHERSLSDWKWSIFLNDHFYPWPFILDLTRKLLRFLRRGGGVVTAVLFWSFSSPLTSETHFDEPSCWTHCLNICPAGSTPVPFTNDILLLSKTKSVFGALFTEKRSNQQSPITMKAAQHNVRPIVAFLHLTFNLKFPGQEQGSTVGPRRFMNPWSRAYLDS